ncbi:MAG TPA: sialidase family protein, partial [Anaerolineales bacterium]
MSCTFATALLLMAFTPLWASAQSDDEPWSPPLNLSHSGVATDPDLVIDSEGRVHVLWFDDSANYLYTQFDGKQWSAPETTDLNSLFQMPGPDVPADPLQLANYTGPNPLFIAGPDQRVFAFWIKPEGRVYISNVESESFKDRAGWGSARLITPEATSFAAAVDALGQIHFAFLLTVDDPDNPPGIYYMKSDNNGGGWTKPVLLYESPYLRTLSAGEAHLSIATAGTEDQLKVYVAWDNRPRKQVFMARSADGGASWEQPELIAGPAPNSGLAGPFKVQVGTLQNSVVLVWQNGQPEGPCTQFYKFSPDAGKTWNEPQPMLQDLMDCAQSNEFMAGWTSNPGDPSFLLTETKSQAVLTAWDGRQWSQPQTQKILSGFEEPEIYTEVVYGCHRASLLRKRLYVVGCDEGGHGDVWVTSRDLGSKSSWFSPPAWSQPSTITSDNPRIDAIQLVATGDDLIHAFFSQREERSIYYSYWDGELWSRLTPVLELPEGEAGSPAVAAGPDNELFLFALNNRGALYFSRAASGNAAIQSSWSTPARLEIGHDGEIGAVDVAEDAAGSLYLAYSVPLNESRGIYLVQSKDNGTSWSEPLQVFNGVTAGFDVVGAPSLVTTDKGLVHIIWKEQSIQGDGVSQSLDLYYTRSDDGGLTFGDPELLLEEPAAWQEIVVDGRGNLHLLWQLQNTMTTVWDQVSPDGGRSWQVAQGL